MAYRKYKNKKIVVDGIIFDSKREAQHYNYLKMIESVGEIRDLQLQKKFVLIPAQREPDKLGKRGGIIKGKLIERECAYYADFYYIDCRNGKEVVVDAKGMKTEVYKIKKKLMLKEYGIRIKEV